MWNYFACLVVGVLIGVALITLIIVVKDPRKPIDHIHVGSLKLVKSENGVLGAMFVDFNNPPDYFVQDQVIDLSVDILDLDDTTNIASRKKHSI